ncbi:MAG TPA: hypothetical protein VH301_08410 [Usitatibacter sp.]|nr:hypothetical protein [Usitatibacter sp.]
MRVAAGLAAAALAAAAPPACAEGWDLAATGYWNVPRGESDFASGIFTADRGALHLEARANYEAIHAQSAFVGWTFSTGESLKLEATPIVGGVWGSTHGAIAGFEASATAGKFDGYIEAEYVRDSASRDSDYTYAWSELGYHPIEPLRLGLVAQRTRIYGGERELQRGGFAQWTHGPATLSVYWFNPGSSDQVVIGALGVAF